MNEQLNAILDSLTERFGSMATEVWGIFVRQQIIEGMTGLIVGIIIGLASLFCYCNYRFWSAKYDKNGEHHFSEMRDGWFLAACIFGVIFLVASIPITVEVLPRLLNPQYYAIKALMP